MKSLSEKYKEQRRERQVREELEAAEREQNEVEFQLERQEHNVARVDLRRQMDQIKAQGAAQRREERDRERLEREQRLQRAMESLSVQAEADPERLLKVPARVQVPAYADPIQYVTRAPYAGFDEGRLMSDARYRLSAALQAAGLFHTKAGHEALASCAAPRPAAQHFVSNVFPREPG